MNKAELKEYLLSGDVPSFPKFNNPNEWEIILDSHTTDRDFQEYIEFLGISERALRQKVLDIGSGKHEMFARQAALKGIEVVSLNPKLKFDENRKMAKAPVVKGHVRTTDSVAALSGHLPFADSSFDTVVSVFGIPHHQQNIEDILNSAQEIERVLKPGGFVFLSPVIEMDKLQSRLCFATTGLEFDYVPIPEGPLLTKIRTSLGRSRLTGMPEYDNFYQFIGFKPDADCLTVQNP